MNDCIITIGIADDHQMMRQGIVSVINNDPRFKVVTEAGNGKELIENLKTLAAMPSMLIIDIAMPVMDGFETIAYISKKYPEQKCIAFSVNNDFVSVFKTIKNGAKAYLKKDCSSEQFFKTLSIVHDEGLYHDSFVANSLVEYHNSAPVEKSSKNSMIILSPRELKFINLACSDMTYKEIADIMGITARTVDTFRDSVFDKINVKSRVGMVIYAIQNDLFKP